MSECKKIVIIGAGYGGVLAAKKLAKKVKKMKEEVTVTLIDKNSYHTMLTELHEVVADRVPQDAIKISLKKIFAGRNVDVVLDEVTSVDFEKRTVIGKDGNYSYDYLVLGTGSKPTFFGTVGAEEHSFKLWSYDDAILLKNQILSCFRKAAVTKDEAKRRELLTFIVVGCGFTGIEMIGELAEYKDRLCQDYDINPAEVRLITLDILPKILPIFPDKLIRKGVRRLNRMGVEVMTSTGITEIGKDYAIVGEDKTRISTQTVVWAAGVESSDLMATVDIEKAGRNRAVTNEYLHLAKDDRVYVVGDNIFYTPEGEERPVPQMVENAEHSSATVANNIIASLKGEEKEVYKPAFHGAMVCIGGKYGLAHLGMPGKFFGLSGFFAMFVKHFINVIYFLQVAGFNKIWTYAMHEIFHVKDRRSLVGGHFAKASPNFWLLPLRLFIGYKWLEEGLTKLPKILEDPNNIFLIPPSAAWPVTAATGAATGEGGAAAWGEALHVPAFMQGLVNQMMDLMFYGPDTFTGLAKYFQIGMVTAEIVIGLMLLAGLFSALASVLSIVVCTMIYTSGMAPHEMLWYWAASIALIGGSGSTFGLDYYVLPWLKKRWKQIGWVKKNYLYID